MDSEGVTQVQSAFLFFKRAPIKYIYIETAGTPCTIVYTFYFFA